MKKLHVILIVSFLLFAPDIAQAKSDKKCKNDDPSCTVSQDDGDRDRDNDDSRGEDQERGDWGSDSDDDDDRDGRGKDKGDRDKDDRDGRDKDKDDRDKDDDDGDGDDRDQSDKKCRKKDDDCTSSEDDDQDTPDEDEGDSDDDDQNTPDEEDDSNEKPKKDTCRKIGDGGIFTQSGDPIIMGFDAFGYNYQAHKFQGFADNASRNVPPVTGGKVYLKMKWNDTYLSNRDCDGNGHLDRHYGHATFYGTDAWLTNMYKWSYIGDDGEVHWVHWFLKATAKPNAEFSCASIGADIFNSHFCWAKSEYRDPYGGSQGLEVMLSFLGFRD